MGEITAQLCDVLRETSAILRQAENTYWADWIDEALRRIESSDYSGIEHLHAGFGGMGSFNDISVSARFDELSNQIYELVSYIRRNAEITG